MDQEKMSNVLTKLVREYPSVKTEIGPETRQTGPTDSLVSVLGRPFGRSSRVRFLHGYRDSPGTHEDAGDLETLCRERD